MAEEYVGLQIGGQTWYGWTRISVQYSAEQAVRQFAATVTDGQSLDAAWNFMPDTEVQVIANGDLLLNGYLEVLTPSYEANNHHIEISGSSKSVDSVDSSHEHETSEFKNQNLLQIAQAIDKQGVGFTTDQVLNPMEYFRLEPGETVFDAINRGARKEGCVLMGEADGSIKITKAGTTSVHPPLIEGLNILGASATFDHRQKHSKYTVKGQRTFGQEAKTSLRIKGEATDSSMSRNRPKTMVHESDGTTDTATKRAEDHRNRAYGNSVSASIKVQGWHDESGNLWTPNTLVYISSPMLKLDMDLLLTGVSLTQDSGGSFAQLTFKHPAALGGSSSSSKTASSEWSPNF